MPKKKSKSVSKVFTEGIIKFVLPILLFIGFMHWINASDIGEGFTTFTNKEKNISPQVLQYEDEVQKYAEEEGIGEYTDLILALMMQESGGRGSDPMQASESLCGSVGCIDDPELSIRQGVSYFANTLNQADNDIKLALQAYNFGAGFIDYVRQNGGKYTQELAIEFSAEKYDELAHTGDYSCVREEAVQYDACYGDIYYVEAVLSYYEQENDEVRLSSISGGGN
ncbi:lysozyme family protein [Halobacillus massiliensis]|uniref:lysozyme family protein n=1 Tax=Halobacillus massiliensis TaxID=1926286 RepID=UPI0009E5F64D|nr:lysozyme family protein [Halobacillus massiliensis]